MINRYKPLVAEVERTPLVSPGFTDDFEAVLEGSDLLFDLLLRVD
jgi:hypothetical protein